MKKLTKDDFTGHQQEAFKQSEKAMKKALHKQQITEFGMFAGTHSVFFVFGDKLLAADGDEEANYPGTWCFITPRTGRIDPIPNMADWVTDGNNINTGLHVEGLGYYPFGDGQAIPFLRLRHERGMLLTIGVLSDEEQNGPGAFQVLDINTQETVARMYGSLEPTYE